MKLLYVKNKLMCFALSVVGVSLLIAGLVQLDLNQQDQLPGVEVQQHSTKKPDLPKIQEVSEEERTVTGAVSPNAFFVEYRMERDRSRSQQVDLWREIVNNANSPEETKNEAQRRLLAMTRTMETEMKMENLIKAENFKDCVVFMEEKSATVIVQAPVLTALDRSRISAIGSRITGLAVDSITVVAKT